MVFLEQMNAILCKIRGENGEMSNLYRSIRLSCFRRGVSEQESKPYTRRVQDLLSCLIVSSGKSAIYLVLLGLSMLVHHMFCH
jgi:hypothetical protein